MSLWRTTNTSEQAQAHPVFGTAPLIASHINPNRLHIKPKGTNHDSKAYDKQHYAANTSEQKHQHVSVFALSIQAPKSPQIPP